MNMFSKAIAVICAGFLTAAFVMAASYTNWGLMPLDADSLANNDVLQYNSTDNEWQASTTPSFDTITAGTVAATTSTVSAALLMSGPISVGTETVATTGALRTYGTSSLSIATTPSLTLGSGTYEGEIKIIMCTTGGGGTTLSVTNHLTTDPEVFTFTVVGQQLWLIWDATNTQWFTALNVGTVGT